MDFIKCFRGDSRKILLGVPAVAVGLSAVSFSAALQKDAASIPNALGAARIQSPPYILINKVYFFWLWHWRWLSPCRFARSVEAKRDSCWLVPIRGLKKSPCRYERSVENRKRLVPIRVYPWTKSIRADTCVPRRMVRACWRISVDTGWCPRRISVVFRQWSVVRSASVPYRFFRDFWDFVIFFWQKSPSRGAKTSEMEW